MNLEKKVFLRNGGYIKYSNYILKLKSQYFHLVVGFFFFFFFFVTE